MYFLLRLWVLAFAVTLIPRVDHHSSYRKPPASNPSSSKLIMTGLHVVASSGGARGTKALGDDEGIVLGLVESSSMDSEMPFGTDGATLGLEETKSEGLREGRLDGTPLGNEDCISM